MRCTTAFTYAGRTFHCINLVSDHEYHAFTLADADVRALDRLLAVVAAAREVADCHLDAATPRARQETAPATEHEAWWGEHAGCLSTLEQRLQQAQVYAVPQ